MGKIRPLPPEIAQKIAAGEVIERPFSVVKELIENSLDAGATRIKVEIKEGGKKLIRVEDNGCGLSPEDVALCFERHATSKISSVDDLEKIATLGFRGEALASIATVSRLVLKSSEGQGGIKVEREAGRLVRISEGAYPRGTSVEVRDLFFNLPARQKFLRSAQTELTHIARYLTTIALAFPEVGFFLQHGERELLNCPAVSTRRERFYQLFGGEALSQLLEINWEEGEYKISGFISRPPLGQKERYRQFFYVNCRPVRDRLIAAVLQQAFKGWLEKGDFPEAYIFLSLPYEEVDVNVHPAKAEVRFRNSLRVFQLILGSVKDALEKEAAAKKISFVQEKKASLAIPSEEMARAAKKVAEDAFPPSWQEKRELSSFSLLDKAELEEKREEESGGKEGEWSVLGQYLNLYIIVAERNSLLIIDQHNAHERILFEKYLELNKNRQWISRPSLFPLVLDLNSVELVRLEEIKSNLLEMGFELENLGGRSISLRSFPDFLEEEEARQVILGWLQETSSPGDPAHYRERLLATMACRTAVKAGSPLTREKMEFLVAELRRTQNPYLCPHGRPIILRLERREIEKGLKRPSN